MDRAEKLQYEKGIEQYFDEHKVYDLFEKLFKELLINKPENPVDYLIERLKRKETKRIFITGQSGTKSKDISLALSNDFGYTCLSTSDLLKKEISKKMENAGKIESNYNQQRLVDDDLVIDLIRNQLINYEEHNLSYIVEGFPRNRTQAIFLQSIGLLPDNVIVLTTSREKSEEEIYNRLKEKYGKKPEEGEPQEPASENSENTNKTDEELRQMAKVSVDEADMNIKAVEDVFSGFYCEIPVDKYEDEEGVTNELSRLLKFKEKTNAARRPPRIILITPPCCGRTEIVNYVANQLKIIPVNVNDLLRKEIAAKNENSKSILDSLGKNALVDDKFVLKLLEDRLYCSDCMINGWILIGFPKSVGQINFMENLNPAIKPSLIVTVDLEQGKIEEKAKKIKYDPKTGRNYREDSKDFSKIPEHIMNRLISQKQNEGEILQKRIETWKVVNDELLQKDYKNLLKLNGEKDEKTISQEIIDAVGYSS